MALIRQHYEADKEKLQKIRALLVRLGVPFEHFHTLTSFINIILRVPFFCFFFFVCLFAFIIICFYVIYSAERKPKKKHRGGLGTRLGNEGRFYVVLEVKGRCHCVRVGEFMRSSVRITSDLLYTNLSRKLQTRSV